MENRLITGPGGETLSYDPHGRLHKTNGTATTHMGYDGVGLITEYASKQRRHHVTPSSSLVGVRPPRTNVSLLHGPDTDDPIL